MIGLLIALYLTDQKKNQKNKSSNQTGRSNSSQSEITPIESPRTSSSYQSPLTRRWITSVIVTVPHARCEASLHQFTQDPCDPASLPVASELTSKLKNLNIPVQLLVGKTLREIQDLNRKWTRGSKFRTDLTKLLRADVALGLPLVLDIHSFPFHSEPPYGLNEMIIIDDVIDFTEYSKGLYMYLEQRSVDVELSKGHDNDIQDEVHELNKIRRRFVAGATLLEFNEQLSPKRRTTIINWIAEWIHLST